eukprot:9713046-Ditylum_brightwellii.AAC.1
MKVTAKLMKGRKRLGEEKLRLENNKRRRKDLSNVAEKDVEEATSSSSSVSSFSSTVQLCSNSGSRSNAEGKRKKRGAAADFF